MPIRKKKGTTCLWYDFRYAGQRHRGSTGETALAAARAYEARLITQLEREGPQPFRGQRAPLLVEFLPTFLASFEARQDRAVKTKMYYRRGAQLLEKTALKDVRLDRVTTDLVARVRFQHSGANANNAIRTLSRVLSHAVDLGYLHTAPNFICDVRQAEK